MKIDLPRQQGAALLTVLLILFIVTVSLSALMVRQQREIRMTALRFDQAQAYQYALAAETAAIARLTADYRQNPSLDHGGEIWASLRAPFQIPEGELRVTMADEQGKLNLNSLIGEREQETVRFAQLLKNLSLDEKILPAIQDWLDEDETRRKDGAETRDYAVQAPAYRSGNQRFFDRSELMLVQGMTLEAYRALEPFVTALPESVYEINVNTASDPLLKALLGEEAWKRLREKMGAKNFLTREELNAAGFSSYGYSTQSDYFTLYVQARYRGASVSLKSLIARGTDRSGDWRVRVIGRNVSPLPQLVSAP